MKRKLSRQIAALAAVVLAFGAFNGAIYTLLTSRLANNFSTTDQAKQVDVGAFLPHVAASDLARLDEPATLVLTGDYPVLDGAAALVPVYASVAEALYPPEAITYEGGVFSDDNYHGENFAEGSAMRYRNTVRGYQAIVDGTADILFCATPSAEQKAYAAERGVELVYTPIGREAFVFFVNADNPVDSLTADQIRAIYAGEITNWREVGGANRTINPLSRLAGSGSQSMMDIFMGDTVTGPKSPLALFGGSIGFSFRYYLADMVADSGVKMLAMNGVYPSVENIASGKYPVVAQFYAITRKGDPNPNTARVVEWLLGEQGQQIIADCGYVPLG